HGWSISPEISGVLRNWKSKFGELRRIKERKEDNQPQPKLQWGMYKFEGEEGLYCPNCYLKEGLKIPCSRVNAKYYQCPNCKASLS
ncbi:MAG: hypothetical protein ABUT20_62355, partial [Bacteroidota bacterium]